MQWVIIGIFLMDMFYVKGGYLYAEIHGSVACLLYENSMKFLRTSHAVGDYRHIFDGHVLCKGRIFVR